MRSIKNTIFFFITLLLLINLNSSLSLTKSKARFLAKESCSNSVLGFHGMCLSDARDYKLPALTQKSLGFLLPTLQTAMRGVGDFADVCLGDYNLSNLGHNSSLGQMRCNGFPLNKDSTIAVLGINIHSLPCSPINVAACIAFDSCGTFALSINGGVMSCALATTGIGAILAPVAAGLDYVRIGFSSNRRFEKSFELLVRNDHWMEVRTINFKGHFFFGFGLNLPLDQINIRGRRLSDILKLNISALFMVDLGAYAGNQMEDLVGNMTEGENNKTLPQQIMGLGACISVTMEGHMEIGLSKITDGFMEDIVLDLKAHAYLTKSTPGNATNLPSGIYLYIKADIIRVIKPLVDSLVKNYAPFLGGFVEKVMPDSIDAALGIFLNTDSMGISISVGENRFKCMFIYSEKKGSCKFNNAIFTAVEQGKDWVVNKANRLFETSGEAISKFKMGVGSLASQFNEGEKRFREELERRERRAKEEDLSEEEEAELERARKIARKLDAIKTGANAVRATHAAISSGVSAVSSAASSAGAAVSSAVSSAGSAISSAASRFKSFIWG